MIKQDTVKLLRECDAGIKMGVSAIDEVVEYIRDDHLKKKLIHSKEEHETLKEEIHVLLSRYHDDGKEPNPMAKSMSWMKTNVKLMMDESDNTVADLICDGSNMGVKSLSRYLNQYAAADEVSKDIAKRLISIEATLSEDMRPYL